MSTRERASKGESPRKGIWKRRLFRAFIFCSSVFVLICGGLYLILRSSLPIQNGKVQLAGLESSVTVERDELGIPNIVADSRADAAQALGFIHAQERFFQMDLLRRKAAGRLSGLIGLAIAGSDEIYLKHEFERLADEVFAKLPVRHKRLLESYTRGVNQGLEELGASPFEYWLLGREPEKWNASDCILVLYSMQTDLQEADGDSEMGLVRLREKTQSLNVPGLYDFLVRPYSKWDAALDDTDLVTHPEIPGPEVFSLRESERAISATEVSSHVLDAEAAGLDECKLGSNCWAVAGQINSDGRALLANDMHLGLRVPAIWYRASIQFEADAQEFKLVGATLPGVPSLVIGSNQHIAWGFTNSYLDLGDIVELKMLPGSEKLYATPDGPQELQVVKETLGIKGGDAEESRVFEYEKSIWGPVVATIGERKFVHHWIAADPEATNVNLIEMEQVTTAKEALKLAAETGCTHCNFTVADSEGNIGWTIVGRLPKRSTGPAKRALDWSETGSTWDGLLPAEQYPQVYNPPGGVIWSANNRMQGGKYAREYAGFFARSGRATQIRDSLLKDASKGFNELDLLKIQLDDRATYLDSWFQSLSSALSSVPETDDSVSAEFRDLLEEWDGHARPESVAFRIISEFRLRMIIRFLGVGSGGNRGLVVEALGLEAESIPFAYDAVLGDLLSKRPINWLPAEYENWDELIVEIASEVETELRQNGPLAEQTWGKRNEVRVQHPISMALPQLASFLDMPVRQLAGSSATPRAQGRSFGASQRMIVSPGSEDSAIYHQPGGQSGHPLSNHYRKGFEAWADGQPTALLHGAAASELILQPAGE